MSFKLDTFLVKALSLLLLFIGSLVAVSALSLIIQSHLPVPYYDEWDMMTNWVWWQHETGSALGSFFQQHNEHRIAIPRLIFFSDLSYLSGKGTLNLIALIGVHGILGLLLWWLVGKALSLTSWPNLALAGGLLVLMFSAIQLKNLLWGFQIQFFGVFLFAILAFWCLIGNGQKEHSRGNPTYTGLLGGIFFSITATFTMANGLLSWPLGLVIGLRDRWGFKKLFLYLAFAFATTWFYFDGYFRNPGHTDPLESLQSPWLLFQYISLYLGHPLSFRDHGLAKLLGGISCIAAVGLFFVFSLDRKNKILLSPYARILLLTLFFIIGTAILTGAGRLEFGLSHATSGRYVTPAVIFWICLAAVFYSTAPLRSLASKLLRQFAFFIGFTLFLTALYNHIELLDHNQHWKSTQMAAVSSLLTGLYDESAIQKIYPKPSRVPKMNEELASMDLSFHSMPWADLPGKRMDEHLTSKTATNCRGHIDLVNEIESETNGFRLHGWAVDTDTALPPEVVIFGKEDSEIVGIAFTGQPRPDVEKLYPGVKKSGWFGHARVSTGQRITAYAMVDEGRSACQLKGQFVRSQH